jgi:ElaA protein
MLKSTEILYKSFQELNTKELYAILALRMEVFCVEQNCPYQDADGLDFKSQHVYIGEENEVIAYARVMPPEQGKCHIGRIVVAQKSRGKKLATKIINACIQYCKKHYPQGIIEISAQSYLTDYYQSLGFKSTGKFYLEDDIPHEQMQILAN